jgi:pimeloyl-ACP methyl ester carboxylesterase
VVLFANPFNELVDLAEDELLRLSERLGRPVRLLAHSFGAVLALHLAMRQPEAIDRVVLLAPVSDIGNAFSRLAQCLSERRADRHRLLAARERYLAARDDVAAFGELARTIMATPDFIDIYWAPNSAPQREAFKSLLEREALFDAATFDAVTRDLFHGPRLQATTRVAGPVSIVWGRHDPLIDPDTESATWTGYFPTATTHMLEAGHFIQLEADAAWFSPTDISSLRT